MKKKIILSITFLISISLYSQKFAYVDTDYILSKMPEFVQAEEQINKYSQEWQLEVQRLKMI